MKSKSAFTLIELLIVIAILGVASTFVVFNFRGYQERARDAKRRTELSQYQNLLEVYATSHSNRYIDTSGSSVQAISQCSALGGSSCTDDPDSSKHYMYQSSNGGGRYVLWAQLDIDDEYYVLCSDGIIKTMPSSWSGPSSGNCP